MLGAWRHVACRDFIGNASDRNMCGLGVGTNVGMAQSILQLFENEKSFHRFY